MGLALGLIQVLQTIAQELLYKDTHLIILERVPPMTFLQSKFVAPPPVQKCNV